MTEQEPVAIITCGGFATRMGGEPKYLLPVTESDRVIDLALDPITRQPELVTRHVILASGAHREAVEDYAEVLRGRHPSITFDISHSNPEGQFHAIAHAAEKYGVEGNVIIMNADEIVPGLDLVSALRVHTDAHHSITRVVTRASNEGTSSLNVDEEDRATFSQTNFSVYATGVIIISPYAMQIAKQCRSSQEFWDIMTTTHQIHVIICEASLNVNTPDDLEEARRRFS